MLAYLAAAIAASTPASAPLPAPQPTPALESAIPWWEKITVTLDDKGTQQSCRYETSASGAAACDEDMAASIKAEGGAPTGVFSKVTFERRFSPNGKPDAGRLQPGDTLLGRQVMFLTIDAKGAITSCQTVSTSGDTPPGYGCNGARKERFKAPPAAGGTVRQAFMTVVAYGHTENFA